MNPVRLHLYVASDTAVAARMAALLREMIDTHLGGQADVIVIDVLHDPDRAEAEDVMATPTVDCVLPLPKRRMVGVPANADDLAAALVLTHMRPAAPTNPGTIDS